MTAGDRDPALARFERDGLLACLGTAAAAGAATRGRLDVVLGVLGGGLLMALSYRAIKGGVDVLAEAARRAGESRREAGPAEGAAPPAEGTAGEVGDGAAAEGTGQAGGPQVPDVPALPRSRKVALAVKFFARYALLAVAAYVMLMCFRLHPVGLVAGALAPFLAAAVQVVRLSRARARRRHP